MLPAYARLTHRDDFSTVVRRGRRTGRTLVVMHILVPQVAEGEPPAGVGPPRVGFAVSKAVGHSVVRHRVARRLRHVMRARLHRLPPGTRLVIRALPRAATADSARLAAEVDRVLGALIPAGSDGS